MNRIISNLLNTTKYMIVGVDYSKPVFKMPAKKLPKKVSRRSLIQQESNIGSELFGPLPVGTRREFFNLDPTTWVWYEESGGQKMTTRYEIKGEKVLISQDNGERSVYGYMDDEKELRNFADLVRRYYEAVSAKVYRTNPATGEPIPQ